MIRLMQQKDNPVIHKIIQRSLEQHHLNLPGTAYFDPQLGALYDYYQAIPNAAYWVVEHEGTVVGGIGIAPFDLSKNICELQKFYIADFAQGLGYGRALMETALAFAEKHYQACYLETMHKLQTACILYEKFNFDLLQQPLPGSDHSTMDAWYIKRF
jgi:putative acetyltransferase